MEEEIIIVSENDFDSSSTSVPIEKATWSTDMVTALVEEYKKIEHEFEEPGNKKKCLWRKIAEGMNKRGYSNVTDVTCDTKWRNLKKTFKEHHIGNRSQVRWNMYFLLLDVFGKEFDETPPEPFQPVEKKRKAEIVEFVEDDCENIDTGVFIKTKKKKVQGNEKKPQLKSEIPASYKIVPTATPASTSRCPDQPPKWFKKFLKIYKRDESNRIEMLKKMHADIVTLEERKCELLEALIQKLNDSKNVKPVDVEELILTEEPLDIKSGSISPNDDHMVDNSVLEDEEDDDEEDVNYEEHGDLFL